MEQVYPELRGAVSQRCGKQVSSGVESGRAAGWVVLEKDG